MSIHPHAAYAEAGRALAEALSGFGEPAPKRVKPRERESEQTHDQSSEVQSEESRASAESRIARAAQKEIAELEIVHELAPPHFSSRIPTPGFIRSEFEVINHMVDGVLSNRLHAIDLGLRYGVCHYVEEEKYIRHIQNGRLNPVQRTIRQIVKAASRKRRLVPGFKVVDGENDLSEGAERSILRLRFCAAKPEREKEIKAEPADTPENLEPFRWTRDEMETLESVIGKYTFKDIHELFLNSRTPNAIQKKASQLGLLGPHKKYWKRSEIRILEDNAGAVPITVLHRELLPDRSMDSIVKKLSDLSHERGWSVQEHSALMNRPKTLSLIDYQKMYMPYRPLVQIHWRECSLQARRDREDPKAESIAGEKRGRE